MYCFARFPAVPGSPPGFPGPPGSVLRRFIDLLRVEKKVEKKVEKNAEKKVEKKVEKKAGDKLTRLYGDFYYGLHSPGSSSTWLLGVLGDKGGVLGAKHGVIRGLKS